MTRKTSRILFALAIVLGFISAFINPLSYNKAFANSEETSVHIYTVDDEGEVITEDVIVNIWDNSYGSHIQQSRSNGEPYRIGLAPGESKLNISSNVLSRDFIDDSNFEITGDLQSVEIYYTFSTGNIAYLNPVERVEEPIEETTEPETPVVPEGKRLLEVQVPEEFYIRNSSYL